MIGYDDFGVDPDGYILMEPGCLFDLSGDSFTSILTDILFLILIFFSEYLHGITQRKEDEINEKVLNRKYLNYEEGEKLQRNNRIAIIIWSE